MEKNYNGWNNSNSRSSGPGKAKQEPLTKTELLIPRVLCIGGKEGEPNYPGSPVKTGQILTLFSSWFYETADEKGTVHRNAVEKHPHLFMSLHWYEERNIEDLPEYVKCISGKLDGRFFKVLPPSQNGRLWHDNNEIEHSYFIRYASSFEPADLSDYQEYQKQNEA